MSDNSTIKSVIYFFLNNLVRKGTMKQPFYSLSCQWAMVPMTECLSKFKIEFVYYYAQYFFHISLFSCSNIYNLHINQPSKIRV